MSTVKKYSKEIFSTKGNSQTGLGEQYHKNKPCSRDFADRARKTYEIVTWMKLFAKHVGDKLPDEDITVLPYRCLKPLFEEYQDVLNAAQGLFGKPAEKSHFYV